MEKDITYKKNMSKNDMFRLLEAVGIPLGILFLSLVTLSVWEEVGTKLLCYMIAIMWGSGFATALYLPSMRREVLNQTCAFIAFYDGAMLGFYKLMEITSGVSPEMISATFHTNIPSVTSNVAPGYITTMMQMSSIMIPIGFAAMQGKRIIQFRRTRSIQKTFGQVRGIGNTGRDKDRMF